MSSHADTIRNVIYLRWATAQEHGDAERALDALLAENQRLRETPRAIYVKVSTALLAEMFEWSDPLRVRIERQADDTYEMTFKREVLAGDAE